MCMLLRTRAACQLKKTSTRCSNGNMINKVSALGENSAVLMEIKQAARADELNAFSIFGPTPRRHLCSPSLCLIKSANRLYSSLNIEG